MTHSNNYNQYLPYKVVEVIIKDRISYKIIQQKKHWIFGLSKKYYDVFEYIINPYVNYKRVCFFKNKQELEQFIKDNTFLIHHRETIVEEH